MEILLVEDDAQLRRLITIILARDYEVTVCTNSDEAIDLIKSPGFETNLVLTDYDCPDKASGGKVTATANLCLPGSGIILMTGGEYTEEDLRQKHEFNYFLHKPFKMKELLEVVGKYSNTHRQTTQR